MGATDFAWQHKIPLDELPTIVAFLERATAMSKQRTPEQSDPSDQCDSQGRDVMYADLMDVDETDVDEADKLSRAQAQLEEKGLNLPPATLEELLKIHSGSVQRVIEALTAV